MAAERKPGSNLGRPATDWNAAFLTYAGLPPRERRYKAVADHHHVSVRTVEWHARTDNWKEKAAAVDREAQQTAATQLAAERARKIGDVEKLIDATFVYYAGLMRDRKVTMGAADLRRLHDLRGEIWADQPVDPAELVAAERPVAVDPTEHKLEVLRALRDAGVLGTDEHHSGKNVGGHHTRDHDAPEQEELA